MQLSEQQVRTILENAPAGSNPTVILDGLVSRGYQLEGVDPVASQARAEQLNQTEAPDTSASEKAGGALNAIFGGGVIGDAIGTQVAKGNLGDTVQKAVIGQDLSPLAEANVEDGPSAKAIAGDAVRAASTFFPIGRVGAAATKGLAAIGLTKGTQTAGNIAAGGLAGGLIDASTDVANSENISFGLETIIGAGLPAASPIVGALGRAIQKGSGIAASEISGALTGTSAETVEQAFQAARAGGDEAERFTQALRGEVTPEALVDTLKTSISEISTGRQALFRNTLDELGDIAVETAPAKSEFVDRLVEARIGIAPSGALDFTRSKLKLVPAAQAKLQSAWQELSKLPEQVTLLDLDTARQAIKGLSLAGEDASANLGNKLIDDAVRAIRSAGEDVPGYSQMLDQFGETSTFLDELTRGLASGDRATIDQTYRRMATALKTNNEQRMALVRELDAVTDGSILSGIAGQQLSEAMPRGIFRQISAGIAGGAVLSGGVSSAIVPALVLASPRVTGEFVRALGIGARKSALIVDTVNDARSSLVKAGIIGGSTIEPANQE